MKKIYTQNELAHFYVDGIITIKEFVNAVVKIEEYRCEEVEKELKNNPNVIWVGVTA